jgi:hypothetical protein
LATLYDAVGDQRVKDLLEDLDIGHQKTVNRLQDFGVYTTESSVRRYRKKYKKRLLDSLKPEAVDTPVTSEGKSGDAEVDPEGATIKKVVVTTPIVDGNWDPILKMFGLNPKHYEVVNDTVRMKTWWVARGKKSETEDRWDPLQMYSYDARFRRINKDMIPQEKVNEWAQFLLQERLDPSLLDRITPTNTIPTSYAMFVADPQLGKKGTEEAVQNWKSGVLNHINAVERLITSGQRVERVHVAFMGDEHENVVNSYTNQPHTIELNRNQQLELDYDLSVWTFKQVARLGLPISGSSVISNHGLWTRNDSKDPVTTNNDNSSTYIRRQVKKLFDELEPFGGPKIDWTIGDTTPGIVVNLSGVDAYMTHGFLEKAKKGGPSTEAKVQSAIEGQILGNTPLLGEVALWFWAHYHHKWSNEFQNRTVFGLPALEATGASEYMRDQYGIWSPSGMFGCLIGNHTTRRYSDVNVY